jgi:DNA ligase, NAD-dependent
MNQLYNQILSLRKELNQHNYNYYVLDAPTITDTEFDFKLKELERLEKAYKEENPSVSEDFFAHSPTQRVGGQINKAFKQVKHTRPMLSLANTYSKGEIIDFVQRAEKLLDSFAEKEWICELKYDGLSVSLTYKNGLLVRALTRGNGLVGDDITQNVKTIRSVPLQLLGNDYPSELEMRGEIIFPLEAFNAFNKKRMEEGDEPMANPRNAASGSIKLLDSKEVAKRHLECYLYFLLSDDISETKHYSRLQMAKKWGFNVPPYMAICHGIEQIMDFINYWDTARQELNFNIDGIVIKLNDTSLWDTLGSTAKSPRWATAYKFKAQRAESKLTSIEYQVGRTGIVTPVANFEPVELGGTIVKRASLNNANFMEKLDIIKGDWVYIEKGGEIIPKIVGINKEKRDNSISQEFHYISTCPICSTPLVREESEAGYYCPNYLHCPPQIYGRFLHFVSKKAMDIDTLGSERVKYLLDNNLVKDFADIYSLTETDLIGLSAADADKKNTIQEKGAANLLNAIDQSKNQPFERVLYALGIRYVGEVGARNLARYFKNIDNLINANLIELTEVNDVGQRIAQSIVDYFSKSENITLIQKLKTKNLQFVIKEQSTTYLLAGKSFVVSGTFESFSRDGIKKIIEDNGGRNVSAVSSKVDYLVAGAKMGSEKEKKAKQLNIKIISEQDFKDLLNEKE